VAAGLFVVVWLCSLLCCLGVGVVVLLSFVLLLW